MQTIPTRQVIVALGGLCLLSVVTFRAEASRSSGGSARSDDTGGSECYAYSPPVDGTLSDYGRTCIAVDPVALCEATTEFGSCPDWAAAVSMAASGDDWWLRVCDGPGGLAGAAIVLVDVGHEYFGFDASGGVIGYAHSQPDDSNGWCCEGVPVFRVEAGIYDGDCTPMPDTDTGATDTGGDPGADKDGGPCGCAGGGGPVSVVFVLLAALGIRTRAHRAAPAAGR